MLSDFIRYVPYLNVFLFNLLQLQFGAVRLRSHKTMLFWWNVLGNRAGQPTHGS